MIHEKRPLVLKVRVCQEELDRWRQMSDFVHVPLSRYVRMLLESSYVKFVSRRSVGHEDE